jgi:hypothetical protein
MTTRHLLEVVAALVMIGGLFGIFVERCRSKRGIGVRIIQFLAVVLVVPTVFVLALEEILSSETVGTLLGAVVGYILSGIGKNETS